MTTLFTALINDEAGFIVSAELVLVATIAVLGMIVGLSQVALNVNSELGDLGTAFGALNQSYSVNGISGCAASTTGTQYTDSVDQCDCPHHVQSIGATGGECAM